MIIDRYIMREILKPTVTICTALMFIFGCYIATRYLADAVSGQLPGSTVILLILLRIAIAFEVLLPMTLYLSVVIALGRLYRDTEMTAMFACGVSKGRVLRAVFMVALIVGVVVAGFSLHIRPWAWGQFFVLKARAKANFDIARMKGGNFYELKDGERVIFAETVDARENIAGRVFIQTRRNDAQQIIFARQVRQLMDHTTGKPVLVFKDATLYDFPRSGGQERITQFENWAMPLGPKDLIQPAFRIKAASTGQLLKSDNTEEQAEFQWRIVAPVSTILLALLGAPLSRSSPRQGKYSKMPMAILIFAVYYNFSAMMKKWVGQGVVDTLPGIWWVQLLLAGLLLILLWQPPVLFRRHHLL